MSGNICPQCGGSMGTAIQKTMLGVPELCRKCEEKRQVARMLAMLPEDQDDPERDKLSDRENNFRDSIRDQFSKRGKLTDKQYQVLGSIYLKRELRRERGTSEN